METVKVFNVSCANSGNNSGVEKTNKQTFQLLIQDALIKSTKHFADIEDMNVKHEGSPSQNV